MRNLGRWSLAAVAFGLGAMAGFALAFGLRPPVEPRLAMAVESRYAHDMFCFAPPDRARLVLDEYAAQLRSVREDSFLWRQEYGTVLLSRAAISDGKDVKLHWDAATKACRDGSWKSCELDDLKLRAAALCPRSASIPSSKSP
jgi:hypothetical protein